MTLSYDLRTLAILHLCYSVFKEQRHLCYPFPRSVFSRSVSRESGYRLTPLQGQPLFSSFFTFFLFYFGDFTAKGCVGTIAGGQYARL